jgi:hypothetical protein
MIKKYTYDEIDAMPRDQWLNYRDDLLNEYLDKGYILKPNPECSACDPLDEYTCLDCEIKQIDKVKIL